MLFQGSGVAIVTPFKKDKSIDYQAYRELLEWHITEGTDAIITCGTTGEASAMSTAEHKAVIEFAVNTVAGRIPVIAGTGSNNTEHAIEMSKYAEEIGADGLLLVTPYYNRTTQPGLVAHFNTIADQVSIPIILYNVPSRTGCNMKAETVAELAKHPNIVAVKAASGNITQISDIARLCPADFILYSGNDDHVIPVMSLGGQGVISVIANILPKETSDMVHLWLKGNIKEALAMQLQMNGLVHALFIENNPIPVKKAMQLLNLPGGELRLPLVEMEPHNIEILKQELKNYGLI